MMVACCVALLMVTFVPKGASSIIWEALCCS